MESMTLAEVVIALSEFGTAHLSVVTNASDRFLNDLHAVQDGEMVRLCRICCRAMDRISGEPDFHTNLHSVHWVQLVFVITTYMVCCLHTEGRSERARAVIALIADSALPMRFMEVYNRHAQAIVGSRLVGLEIADQESNLFLLGQCALIGATHHLVHFFKYHSSPVEYDQSSNDNNASIASRALSVSLNTYPIAHGVRLEQIAILRDLAALGLEPNWNHMHLAFSDLIKTGLWKAKTDASNRVWIYDAMIRIFSAFQNDESTEFERKECRNLQVEFFKYWHGAGIGSLVRSTRGMWRGRNPFPELCFTKDETRVIWTVDWLTTPGICRLTWSSEEEEDREARDRRDRQLQPSWFCTGSGLESRIVSSFQVP